MSENHVCPVERAGHLDGRIRRWLHNPRKILSGHVLEGMTALDIGCGPGFFSIEMACMTGASGRVIAADLQEGMLQKIRDKIRGTEIESRITLHRCESDRLGVEEKADFALAFYMVHEAPDKEKFFRELHGIIKPGGRLLIVEPKLVHVSKKDFLATVRKAEEAGFRLLGNPKVAFSQSALLQNG